MKKRKLIVLTGLLVLLLPGPKALAQTGDMGFYGGISQGRKLPKTTEIAVNETKSKKSKKTQTDNFVYKELLLVTGYPEEFEGTMTVKVSGGVTDDVDAGTYTVTHTIKPGTAEQEVQLNRDIKYDVNWRREGNQIIMNYEISKWSEDILSNNADYYLDTDRSNMNISIIEDHTPGVTYKKGNITANLVYTSNGEGDGEITVQSAGTIYGYDSAWSSIETHRTNTWVYGDGWQTQYQLRPSVSVTKQMQYSQNEPTAISFAGNYTEIIQNTSVLSYNIYNKPHWLYDIEDYGLISISNFNSIEQLVAPDTAFLKGHFAEDDIKRLFSMQILSGEPKYFQPDQAMTRGQYVEALAKAAKLSIEEPQAKKSGKKSSTTQPIFPDVQEDREEYPYIMAAYKNGLAIGRDNGNFFIDSPIQRQEAIVILIRTLGLEQLGLDPTPVTSFVDDSQIGAWAKREIQAASVLGIIYPDADGKLNPTKNITKAEGAAMVNRLINYMRKDMVTDYTDNIVNHAN